MHNSSLNSEIQTLIKFVEEELHNTTGPFGVDPHEIVEGVLRHVVKALRADRRIPARDQIGWELYFAAAAAAAVREIEDELAPYDSLIEPREAVWAIESYFAKALPKRNEGLSQAAAP